MAAACAQFPLPVITGIGHERDETVLDAVAHTRVKTPTAAAAFLIAHQVETASVLDGLARRISQAARWRMEREQNRLAGMSVKWGGAWQRVKSGGMHRLELLSQRLRYACRSRLSEGDHRLVVCGERLSASLPVRMERERFRLRLLQQRCEAADPAVLLKRGYSMTWCNGTLVRAAGQLKQGDETPHVWRTVKSALWYNNIQVMEKEKMSYEKAMARLEELVRAVENNETGIDSLAEQLKEAQQLIAFCREKLFATEEEIRKILEEEEKQ